MAIIRSGVNRLKMMKGKLGAAMEEVHKSIPKNVKKTGKKGKAKEAMLQAIAFSKAGLSKKK